MRLKQALILLFLMFSAVVRAQTTVRKAYPAPKVTPQVQRIRSTMRPMRLDTEG